jgi:flagellin
MAFSVNTNNNALAALQTLNMTQRSMSATQAHINSGLKIAGAKDDASTFAIAQGMRGDISGLGAVQSNIALGQATVNVALSAAQTISSKLNDLKSLVIKSQGVGVDTASVQKDVKATLDSIDSTAKAAQFNGINLLNSSGTGMSVVSSLNRTDATTVGTATLAISQQDLTTAGTSLNLATLDVTAPANNAATFKLGNTPTIAANDTITLSATDGAGNAKDFVFEFIDASNQTTLATQPSTGTKVIQVDFDSASDSPTSTLAKAFDALRQEGFAVKVGDNGDFTVSREDMTAAAATWAGGTIDTSGTPGGDQITSVEDAITNVKSVLATLGSYTNQLQTQADFVKSLSDTLTSGVGTLVDADLAEESANLQALQTKQQLGIQALSIANQSSSAVLSLFR